MYGFLTSVVISTTNAPDACKNLNITLYDSILQFLCKDVWHQIV